MGRLSKKKPASASQAKSQTKITGFFQIPGSSQKFTKIEGGEKGEKTDVLLSPEKTKAMVNTTVQQRLRDGENLRITNGDNNISKETKSVEKKAGIMIINKSPILTKQSRSSTEYDNSFLSPSKKDNNALNMIENSQVTKKEHVTSFKTVAESYKRKLESPEENDSLKRMKTDPTNGENKTDRTCHKKATPTKKILETIEDEMEDFDFDDDDFNFASTEDIDSLDGAESNVEMPLAAKYNRHKILEIDDTVSRQLILILEDQFHTNIKRKAIIKDSWLQTVFTENDIVHIEGKFDNDVITISDLAGSIIVNPDMLVSGTSVVSALFCLRKAVLSEIYKGGGGRGNKVMLVGTMVHQLFQDVLDKKEYKKENITDMMNCMIQSPAMIREMAYLGLTEQEMRKDISPFIHHIQYFVKKFIHGEKIAAPEPSTPDKMKKGLQRPQWKGRIDRIADIEENIWSPRLGIKGKIDLTVKTAGNTKLIPLELKTGRPSFSAEHAGQVKLYTMMSRDRREDPGSGLLLYLRSSNMVEIPAGRHEERGLVQLRNQLVAYLSQQVTFNDSQVSDLVLPEPIDFEKGCTNCDLVDICCAYLTINDDIPGGNHHMATLAPDTLHHLKPSHLEWFKKWSNMLRLEASHSKHNQKILWTETARTRESIGSCISDMSLNTVTKENIHSFTRSSFPQIFQAGEVVVVSSSTELVLSQGPVLHLDSSSILVQLDRTLPRNKVYHIDRYVYQGSMGSNFVAIGKLLINSPEAEKLRRIIIEGAGASYLPGLPRETAIIARGLIKSLNKVQQKAIFRCMMTENYCLLRGMPGSGKSTTIVGLIRLLAAMGQSVLLVAYTNSAVDTVLVKLQEHEKHFLRLGRGSRVRKELEEHTADKIGSHVTNCDELAKLYATYRIIGTTCLATDHAAIVNRKFDWCIVDEASQALLPSVVHPLLHAHKFILVGDPAQLPPVVQSTAARKLGLHQSLFDVLDKGDATISLNIQYRMNKVISALANHLTYKGKLECANESVANRTLKVEVPTDGSVKLWMQKIFSAKLEDSVVFLDTNCLSSEETGNNGILNIGEAGIVTSIIQQGVKLGILETDIAVIAPYTAQVKYLQVQLSKKGLSEVEVGTVDQFQGRDSQAVIYSCTRSFKKPASDEKGGVKAGHILTDERRLNVAITRAKSKLVMVGCLDTLVREYKPFRDMESFMVDGRIVKLTNKDEI